MSNPDSGNLGDWLAELPQHEPPAQLWSRILQTRLDQQQKALRQRSILAAASIAASLLLAVLVLTASPRGAPETAPVANELARISLLMQTTEQLEKQLQAQAERFALLAEQRQQLILGQQAQLVALDRTLAAAYSRKESADRLAQLWQRRVDLMTGLMSLYDDPSNEEKT